MNGSIVMWILICLLATAPFAITADDGEGQQLPIEVALADGSILKGTAGLPDVCDIFAPYGHMTVRVDHMAQLVRNPDSGHVLLHMQNGDTIGGDLLLESFILESLVGSLVVSLKDLTSIRFTPSESITVPVSQPVNTALFLSYFFIVLMRFRHP